MKSQQMPPDWFMKDHFPGIRENLTPEQIRIAKEKWQEHVIEFQLMKRETYG